MTTAILYHNPRCSKSRQTLQLLEAAGVATDIIDYQKTPPDVATLTRIRKLLNVPTRAMMRTKEDIYKQLKLDTQTDEQALLLAIAAHPILLERPIVIYKNKAVIGRPPQNVQAIL